MKQYTWANDSTEEIWNHDVFSSPEGCIVDAKENYLIPEGETIAIGETVKYEINVCADTVLEHLCEDAFEECGEVADSWAPWRDEDKVLELSKRLSSCVSDWLKEIKEYPEFYKIVNIKTYTVK